MTTLRNLPLRRWHEAQGAESFGELGGFRVPMRYDDRRNRDPEAERRVLATGLGLFDRSAFSRLELLGEDRVRFLNGLVTCDVQSLTAGSGAFGYLTDQKAGILADVAIYALEDRFWLDLPPGREVAVREHLEKYIVADRVEVVALDEMIPLALVGPGIDPGLGNKTFPVTLGQPWSHARATLWGSEVRVTRNERLGQPGVVVWVSASIADLFADDLLAQVVAANGEALRPIGFEAYNDQRIRSGVGLFDVDFDEKTLPQELGDDGIDFEKGCYLGQEVVARLHFRGQVPRQLRRLVLDDDSVTVEIGSEIIYEDRGAGTLTSLTQSAPRVALARVARRAFDAGTSVRVAGSTATVELNRK